MIKPDLSPTMKKALAKLTDKWQLADELVYPRSTLDALVVRRLAERRMFRLRPWGVRAYTRWEYRRRQIP